MSKFGSIKLQISDFKKHNNIEAKDLTPRDLERLSAKLIKVFAEVKDSRVEGRITYRLCDLLACMFLADLAGAESSSEVVDFWVSHGKLYKRIFKKATIPSHDTFRRVLGLIDSENMEEVLACSMSKILATLRKVLHITPSEKKIISVDGKQERGTGRKPGTSQEVKDLQILNVYDQEDETCICSKPIEVKTNEIPTAQAILKTLNLKNSVITFDALNTQTETIRTIVDKKGDYVGGLKGNQGSLHDYTIELFDEKHLKKLESSDSTYLKTTEVSHNRFEKRKFFLHKVTAKEKAEFSDWKNLRSIVCYVKDSTDKVTGKTTSELRTYISSLTEIEDISYCIRGHWGIENNLHWLLDTAFHEDGMHIADRNAATNQSIINKAALQVCKLAEDLSGRKQRSVRRRRKSFGWAFETNLAMLLSLMDEKSFYKAFSISAK